MVQRRPWYALMPAKLIKRRVLGSWLRLRCAARLIAPPRGSGLTLLVALASLAPLALTVLGLTVLWLSVLGLTFPAAAFFARRQIGGRGLLVLADDDLGAVGQIGKAGRHHAIGGRQSAGDDGVGFVLLCHHNRFRRDNVTVADDVAERSRRPALHRRRRHHYRLCEGVDLETHIDELPRP